MAIEAHRSSRVPKRVNNKNWRIIMSATNVIKHPSSTKNSGPSTAIIKREIIDARAEAQGIVAEAEAQAAALRRTSEIFAREAREQAFKQGMEAALAKISNDMIEAREMRDTALAQVERDVLRLAVKIAEKIIGREIETSDATTADIVATALREARQNERVTLRVNPGDLPAIKKYRARLEPRGRIRFLDFAPDPRVERGGCQIVTETGAIDAQLSTQLRVLESALLARASGERD
jgi:type III secretion protein L